MSVGLFRQLSGAKEMTTKIQVRQLAEAIESYRLAHSHYPQSLSELELDDDQVLGPDPWGHGYLYAMPGIHNPRRFDLSSAGADGIAGTTDDLGNWRGVP